MLKSLFRRFGYSLQRIDKSESEDDILHKAIVLGAVAWLVTQASEHDDLLLV